MRTFLEREVIRIRKESGAPKPWTEDPIFQDWKFCNCRRSDDKTSRLLRAEFFEPNREAPAEQILLNAGIARWFGTIDYMRAVGWQKHFAPELLRDIARSRLDAGERVFSPAYIINNGGKSERKEVVVAGYLGAMWQIRRDVIAAIKETASMRRAMMALMEADGFGPFMSAQVLLDTRWTNLWPKPPVDRMSYCGIGPGARRGAGRMKYGRFEILSEPETLSVLRQLLAMVPDCLPRELHDLELCDIQHCACEFDKFQRVLNGEGSPRSRYPGL